LTGSRTQESLSDIYIDYFIQEFSGTFFPSDFETEMSSRVEKIATDCAVFCHRKGLVQFSEVQRVAHYVARVLFMLYTSSSIITDTLDTVFLTLEMEEALKPAFEHENLRLRFGYTKDGSAPGGDLNIAIMFDDGSMLKTTLPRSDGPSAFGPDLWAHLNSRNVVIQMTQNPVEKKCFQCDATGQLKRCSACRVACYCSDACQKKNWKEHKHFCRETVALGLTGMVNIERAPTSLIVEKLQESKLKSVCTRHARARIGLSSTSVELSEVQVSPEASSDVDAYVFELAKKMAQAALEVGRELHVNDSKLLDVLRKRPGCFAYTF
jgi:hypothetical protein